jgi:spermidine synthase
MNRRLLLCSGLLALLALAAPVCAAETVLYDKASPYSRIVVSEDDKGYRMLRFEKNGPRQSVVKPGDPDYLGLPYTKAAFVGLALAAEPRRILIIGHGGGTLPMFLRKHYPDAAIDSVDIDPDVVDVSKKYFGFREDARLRAYVDDGRAFIESVREPYDIIFLDAYGNDSLPMHLTTQEFLRAVRKAVRPDGVVVGNVWSRHTNPYYDAMVRTYQEVFDELVVLGVRDAGNQILLALPRRQPLSPDQLAQLAGKVSADKRFRFDLSDAAVYRFEYAQAKSPTARVLRDQDLASGARDNPAPQPRPTR